MRNHAKVIRHANRVCIEIINSGSLVTSACEPLYDNGKPYAVELDALVRRNAAYDAMESFAASHNARIVDFIDASSE